MPKYQKHLNIRFLCIWMPFEYWSGIQVVVDSSSIVGSSRIFGLHRQWMIAQMVERLLCTQRTRVQIPAPAPYEITL